MKLIVFTINKILQEEKGKIYELMGYTKEEVKNEKDKQWKKYLQSDGLKQVIEVTDMGGTDIEIKYINLSEGQKPFKVGDTGVH